MPGSSRAARRREQGVRPDTYLFFFVSFALVVLLTHSPYFSLPYFWDELGQFVPAALDILRDGAWVPHSTVPNAHPPGVMAYLAGVWKIVGYSIVATRAAMLLLGSLAVLATFLLAIHLCRGLAGAPAFIPVLLLLFDPLFYTQSMMAQLDMPAMLFTLLGLLLFLQDHHKAAALACTALVLCKETGALLPLILGIVLLADPARVKYSAYYLAPFLALAAWFFVLWQATGQILGDAGYAHYNVGYALHPVRAAICLARRIYYLFIDDFRWIGFIAILLAWKKTHIYSNRAWRITWLFFGSHVLMVSLLGGAELERYLLPVIPLLYIAMAAAWSALRPRWRNISVAAVCGGLLAGLFFNPPFPFPYENNLAMVDFVELHHNAAEFLERSSPKETVYTAWPLTGALRDPAFGYVRHKLATAETSDFGYSTLQKIDPKSVTVLVLYSRTWEPAWGVLRWPLVARFLHHFYQYEPQMTASQVQQHFGLESVSRWTQRGQWIEIYARENISGRR
ncbi:MAG TPA: phospholipid carrier-dependent glycosyltransferase [Bryobacteraceae bacterium]|nr:phospholipid carrier-dependent glycosyltransferase [Bryobacteraceae bacterium]